MLRPVLTSALLLAAVVVAAVAHGDAAPRCGVPGKPPCPLQRYMRAEVAEPLARGDGEALARALERVERLNPRPAKWGNWTRFARDGAAGARAGDLGRARASCGSCHRIYRRQYNFEMRDRSVTPGG